MKDIASDIDGDETSKKGLQEKVSGWLDRYDFVSPIRNYLWREGLKLVERNTVIAIDSGDISKEFGGAGMEGMEMGYDASRGVIAMGHSLLCAAVVMRTRAVTLRLDLMRGRKGLPDAEIAMYGAIINEVNDYGIIVLDRGFDNTRFISHNLYSRHRSVIRIKETKRDAFGTKRSVEEEMAYTPCVQTTLRSPTRCVEAKIQWRNKGSF